MLHKERSTHDPKDVWQYQEAKANQLIDIFLNAPCPEVDLDISRSPELPRVFDF